MPTSIDLQFRPTLIIFVGEGGALIREYLSPYYDGVKLQDGTLVSRKTGGVGNRSKEPHYRYHLLSNLDTPLHNSVALLQVVSEGPSVGPEHLDLVIPFPTLENFPNDPDVPKEQGEVESTVERALRSIMMDRHMIAMRDQGYKVSNTRPQVFIVGEPTPIDTSPPDSGNKIWMGKLLGIVREQFQKHKFEAPVFYFLNTYGPSADFSPTLKKAGTSSWQDYHQANLSLVYEYQIPYPMPVTVSENEQRYATAQALLGLMATGITSSSFFEQEMRIPAYLEDYSDQVSNFSTGMVMFPRAITRRFCGSLLSGALVEKWQQDLKNARVPDDVRRKARDDANKLVNDIHEWIIDIEPYGDPRPAAEENYWPNFRILRGDPKKHPESEMIAYQQRDKYRELVLHTGELFSTFSKADITEEYEQYPPKSRTWVSLAYERCHKAESKFAVWRHQASVVWEAMENRTGVEVRHRVDERWVDGKSGPEVARVYVDALDVQLVKLQEKVQKRPEIHFRAYEAKREWYRNLAEGDWALGENESNIKDPNAPLAQAQASPQMNNIAVGGAAAAGAAGIAGNTPQAPAEPQYLPEPEFKIASALRSRAEWKQNQVPPGATLGFTAVLGLLSLVLMLTLFNIPLLAQVVADAALVASFIVGNLLFRRKRQQDSDIAHEDMLGFYRRYFVYKCESYEDSQRFGLLRYWRTMVDRYRKRLDNMQAFLTTINDGVVSHAGELNFELFHGPTFERDVFVANGERLVEKGSHTLESIFTKIEQQRKNHPVQVWHGTLDDIRDALIAHVQERNLSLLLIKEDELQEVLISFNSRIVDDYLVGSLVEIGPALSKSDVWRDILARVRRPMYAANVGNLDSRYTFICGTPQALAACAQFIPSDAIQVQTKKPEWVLLGSFFRGGKPAMVDADKLFPPK